MLPNPFACYAVLCAISVKWDNGTKEDVKIRQYSPHQNLSVEVKEPAIVGFFNPTSFAELDTVPDGINEVPRRPEFTPGDVVEIQLEKLAGIKLRDVNTGERLRYRWVRFSQFFSCFNICY